MRTDITRQIAQYIATTSYDSLPQDVIEHCKRSMMDYFAAVLLGSEHPKTRILADYLKETNAASECSVLGFDFKLDAASSAFVNGCSTHAYDFDDGHTKGSIHVEAVVFPAVLSVAEKYNASPRQIIEAIIVGYDTMIRISMAMHPHALNRGFHNTPVAGVFGATAAAAKILGLDEEQIINALGLAGSFSGGLYAYMQNGADTKRLHPGKAARDGIICAELAKKGYVGPSQIFEGIHNFFAAIPGHVDEDLLLNGLGSIYEICNIYQKPYACCRHMHGPMDCIYTIRREHPAVMRYEDIQEIRVGTYAVAMKHAGKGHDNRLAVQMSIPCGIVMCMLDEEITLDSFSAKRFSDGSIETALLDKITVFPYEECEKLYPAARPTRVWVEMKNGETYFAGMDNPRGGAACPFTAHDLENKLHTNTRGILADEQCETLMELIWSLDNLSADSLQKLYSGCR